MTATCPSPEAASRGCHHRVRRHHLFHRHVHQTRSPYTSHRCLFAPTPICLSSKPISTPVCLRGISKYGRGQLLRRAGDLEGLVFLIRSRRPTSDTANARPEINLSELQKSLDKTALEVVENQKENMVGRKKLAEQTRGEFSVS